MDGQTDAPIGITGATGQLGGRVARRLADAGVAQRLLVRDPSRAPSLAGSTTARCDYAAPLPASLEGLRVLLMVSAPEGPDRLAQHLALVDAAAAAGVEHVVYTSFVGASRDAVFTLARDHGATEEHLRASGMTWTFVRDNLYADVLPHFAGEDGVLAGPAGQGRFAPVTRDDVADCLAAVLPDAAGHAGAAYALTGPEELTFQEVAALLTEVTGRDHTFVDETLEQARASRTAVGVPEWQVQAWVSTYTAIAAGEMAGVSPDVERLSGHPATSLLEHLLTR